MGADSGAILVEGGLAALRVLQPGVRRREIVKSGPHLPPQQLRRAGDIAYRYLEEIASLYISYLRVGILLFLSGR